MFSYNRAFIYILLQSSIIEARELQCKMKKVLLLGGAGLVGTRIRDLFSTTFRIVSPFHAELDVTNHAAVKLFIAAQQPDVIIYAAGITNPDKAEEYREEAFAVNAEAPRMIAAIAKETKIKLLYLSTDAVFNGSGRHPFKEDDQTDPVNYYGYTKRKGEEFVLRASDTNSVLRLITVYSDFFSGKKDIARLAIDAFIRRESFAGIMDQYFSPTYVDHVVYAVAQVINKNVSGILHIGARDCISNYAFVSLLAKLGGFEDARITSVSFTEFYKDKKAKRSNYACLDTAKALSILDNSCIVPIAEGLRLFLKNYHSRFSQS